MSKSGTSLFNPIKKNPSMHKKWFALPNITPRSLQKLVAKKHMERLRAIHLLVLVLIFFPCFIKSDCSVIVDQGASIWDERMQTYHIGDSMSNVTELELFFDELISAQLQDLHIAGATLAVVGNGSVLLTKGYGYRNIAPSRPVLADETLFRVASISKTFVATAVMQLVENGTLDLNANVNTYLETFKVPDTFPEPVTLTHLLTHTAGFEENYVPITVYTDNNLPSLEEILTEEIPARVWPVGEASAYSNWGYALAGYIIQEMSGIRFEDYIDEYILQPLGMEHSSFYQDLPYPLDRDHSRGYVYDDDSGFIPQYPEIMTIPPAGGLSTTATDMAVFMLANLQNGTYNGHRILENETIQEMHQPHFTSHAVMPGVCLGFYEMVINNQTVITHEGDARFFKSQMTLLPEHGIGLFISYNTPTSEEPRKDLLEAFMDEYFPLPHSSVVPIPDHSERVHRYVGHYMKMRTAYTTVEKFELLTALPYATVEVVANSDGTIQLFGETYVEVEPLLFREVTGDSDRIFAFVEDENGVITHLYDSDFCPTAWKRLQWYESPPFFEGLLWFSLFFLLLTLIGWLAGAIRNHLRHQPRVHLPARIARWLVVPMFLSYISLLLLSGPAVDARYRLLDSEIHPVEYLTLQSTYYSNMQLVLILPLIITITAFLCAAFVLMAWTGKGSKGLGPYWNLSGRIHYTSVVLLGLVLVWFLSYWNAIGFLL